MYVGLIFQVVSVVWDTIRTWALSLPWGKGFKKQVGASDHLEKYHLKHDLLDTPEVYSTSSPLKATVVGWLYTFLFG